MNCPITELYIQQVINEMGRQGESQIVNIRKNIKNNYKGYYGNNPNPSFNKSRGKNLYVNTLLLIFENLEFIQDWIISKDMIVE